MRSIRDMIRDLVSRRHDRRELPFTRHQARHRALIRDLIVMARAQDARQAASAKAKNKKATLVR